MVILNLKHSFAKTRAPGGAAAVMPREARFPRELALGKLQSLQRLQEHFAEPSPALKEDELGLAHARAIFRFLRISSSVQTMSAVWLSLYSEGAILRTSTFVRYAQSTVLMRSVTRA